jgi:hypothetical protein
MAKRQLIQRQNWRNERVRKTLFQRADQMEYAFVLHINPSNSARQNKMKALLSASPDSKKAPNNYQKNNQTENIFSHCKQSKGLPAIHGATILLFLSPISPGLDSFRQLTKSLQNNYILLGLVSKEDFYNQLDVQKLLEIQPNQHALLTEHLSSQII